MAKIPVQIELPHNFVPKTDPEYFPPLSHDAREIERRRGLPKGTLVVEQQYLGAVAAGLFLSQLSENGTHEDEMFGGSVMHAAMLGSARFSLRGGEFVMRRHLHLPRVADPDTDMRMTNTGIRQTALDELVLATEMSKELYDRKRETGRIPLRMSHRFGHAIGDVAMWTAMMTHDEIGPTGTSSEVQKAVLQVGMEALDNTRRLRTRVGQNLSLAMIGGRTARLMTYFEENATPGAFDALNDAQNEAAKLLDVA